MFLLNFLIVPKAIFNKFILIGMTGWDWKRITKDDNLFAQKCAEHTTLGSMYVFTRVSFHGLLFFYQLLILSLFLFLEQPHITNILKFSAKKLSSCNVYPRLTENVCNSYMVFQKLLFFSHSIIMARAASYRIHPGIMCVSF